VAEEVIIGDCRLILGDCREVLPGLPKHDLLLTDPPYGISLNTDNRRFSGGNLASISKRGKGIGSAEGLGIFGDNDPFDPSFLCDYGRWKIVWGWNNFPDKLPRGACLVWLKRLDPAFGSFLSDAETAWMSKGSGVYCRRDLSNNAIANDRDHPTQKPVSLMLWCLEFFPMSNSVLDPFMGSGTTGVACVRLGKSFTGIERERKYFDIACERIENAYRQAPLVPHVQQAKQVQEALL
jgi:DNA modification methylase